MDELEPSSEDGLMIDIAKQDDGTVVVTLSGELDMSNVGEVEAAAEPVIGTHPPRLIVDVGRVSFVDSSVIALWVRWTNVVHRIEIREASELLRAVIKRMGLAERLQLTP